MPEPIPEAAHRIVDEPNFGHVVTLMPDGMPQTTPVWIDREDGTVVFNTAKGRAKHRNLERDPRIALSVHDRDNPYTYLQVRGTAELVEEGADAHIDKMAQKYFGVARYPSAEPGEQRVIVRILAETVDYHSPRD